MVNMVHYWSEASSVIIMTTLRIDNAVQDQIVEISTDSLCNRGFGYVIINNKICGFEIFKICIVEVHNMPCHGFESFKLYTIDLSYLNVILSYPLKTMFMRVYCFHICLYV